MSTSDQSPSDEEFDPETIGQTYIPKHNAREPQGKDMESLHRYFCARAEDELINEVAERDQDQQDRAAEQLLYKCLQESLQSRHPVLAGLIDKMHVDSLPHEPTRSAGACRIIRSRLLQLMQQGKSDIVFTAANAVAAKWGLYQKISTEHYKDGRSEFFRRHPLELYDHVVQMRFRDLASRQLSRSSFDYTRR